MDIATFRETQGPLRARYRSDAAAAILTLRAKGKADDATVTCKVETGRGLALAGIHPKCGGSGLELCSGDMLLEALIACAGISLRAAATVLDIPIKSALVSAEGDVDLRGTLGVTEGVPVGFKKSACVSKSRPTNRRTGSISCSRSPTATAWCFRPSRTARRPRCGSTPCATPERSATTLE